MSMVRFYLEGNIKEQNSQWRIQGRGPRGPGSPLIFRPSRRQEGPSKISLRPPPPPPPPLSQGLDDRAHPLSEGLDPPLIFPLF